MLGQNICINVVKEQYYVELVLILLQKITRIVIIQSLILIMFVITLYTFDL